MTKQQIDLGLCLASLCAKVCPLPLKEYSLVWGTRGQESFVFCNKIEKDLGIEDLQGWSMISQWKVNSLLPIYLSPFSSKYLLSLLERWPFWLYRAFSFIVCLHKACQFNSSLLIWKYFDFPVVSHSAPALCREGSISLRIYVCRYSCRLNVLY